jgi:8-oxo-dGTP diphosphatase
VCTIGDGRVLLCRNHRGEWELPGGRPDHGERMEDCVVREVREETGLDVTVDRLLGVHPLEVIPGTWVDVIAYHCLLPANTEHVTLHTSSEHTHLAFLHPTSLPDTALPRPYKDLIALHNAGG